MKKIVSVLLVAVLMFHVGCASIIHGGREPLALNSQPSGAEVVVVDDRGTEVYRGQTPASVSLKPGRSYFKKVKYAITFTKPGLAPVTVHTDSKIVGWYWANFAIGGVSGFFIVDPLTGDMYTFKRKTVNVDLAQPQSSLTPPEMQLRIISLDDVPAHARDRLVKVN